MRSLLKSPKHATFQVKSFGLQQFLHGPRVTLDKLSSLVAFTSMTEPRKDSLIKYAQTIGTEVIEINGKYIQWRFQRIYMVRATSLRSTLGIRII